MTDEDRIRAEPDQGEEQKCKIQIKDISAQLAQVASLQGTMAVKLLRPEIKPASKQALAMYKNAPAKKAKAKAPAKAPGNVKARVEEFGQMYDQVSDQVLDSGDEDGYWDEFTKDSRISAGPDNPLGFKF